jgi:hypothetical protein
MNKASGFHPIYTAIIASYCKEVMLDVCSAVAKAYGM